MANHHITITVKGGRLRPLSGDVELMLADMRRADPTMPVLLWLDTGNYSEKIRTLQKQIREAMDPRYARRH